eukprot:GHVT01073031.1.p1 GENE.GHVT01073031.1~~GHVT01073031.1.p1  ORF type:complete len:474 (-),score=164.82 GHVT01073031.1:425-1804(-)
MAMILYRGEEEAQPFINQLCGDNDPLIRYGAMFAIGMASCGTAKDTAVRQLLNVSVSDVSDDVRRAAVINLGFVLANAPDQVPKLLKLLACSYNQHVRYGSAIAIGVACAGTGSAEALDLLMPLTTDSTDFVRQGAFTGLGLVLQQCNSARAPRLRRIRESLGSTIADKHENVITRFGALVAAGLIDAGGRNVVSSFTSSRGHLVKEAAAGFCLFAQSWYWFALVHCVSLTLRPTAILGISDDVELAEGFSVDLAAGARLDFFEYPQVASTEKKEEKRSTLKAVLSTTAKRQQMQLKKQLSQQLLAHGENKPGTSSSSEAKPSDGAAALPGLKEGEDSAMEEQRGEEAKAEEADVEMNAASSSTSANQAADDASLSSSSSSSSSASSLPRTLHNPCRILRIQEQCVTFPNKGRYQPMFPDRHSGFLILKDTTPSEPRLVVCAAAPADEPSAPEPFDWSG